MVCRSLFFSPSPLSSSNQPQPQSFFFSSFLRSDFSSLFFFYLRCLEESICSFLFFLFFSTFYLSTFVYLYLSTSLSIASFYPCPFAILSFYLGSTWRGNFSRQSRAVNSSYDHLLEGDATGRSLMLLKNPYLSLRRSGLTLPALSFIIITTITIITTTITTTTTYRAI